MECSTCGFQAQQEEVYSDHIINNHPNNESEDPASMREEVCFSKNIGYVIFVILILKRKRNLKIMWFFNISLQVGSLGPVPVTSVNAELLMLANKQVW